MKQFNSLSLSRETAKNQTKHKKPHYVSITIFHSNPSSTELCSILPATMQWFTDMLQRNLSCCYTRPYYKLELIVNIFSVDPFPYFHCSESALFSHSYFGCFSASRVNEHQTDLCCSWRVRANRPLPVDLVIWRAVILPKLNDWSMCLHRSAVR